MRTNGKTDREVADARKLLDLEVRRERLRRLKLMNDRLEHMLERKRKQDRPPRFGGSDPLVN